MMALVGGCGIHRFGYVTFKPVDVSYQAVLAMSHKLAASSVDCNPWHLAVGQALPTTRLLYYDEATLRSLCNM